MASSIQEAAPWADMDTDCLVHVFRRLDLEDLASSALLVCRGWRRAATDPSLWRTLDLRSRRYAVDAGFLKLCMSRARGCAEDVALLPLLDDEADEIIHHISIQCPRLRRLALPQLTADGEARLPKLVARWPRLEHLELRAKPSSSFPALAAQLARHCPSFASLKMTSSVTVVTADDAAALATTRLRSLCLDGSYLRKEQLLAILAACTGLREFTARSCVGFDENDEEVLRRGACIQLFDVRGSKLVEDLGLLWIGGI